MPESIKEKTSVGDKLRTIGTEGSKAVISQLISKAFSNAPMQFPGFDI